MEYLKIKSILSEDNSLKQASDNAIHSKTHIMAIMSGTISTPTMKGNLNKLVNLLLEPYPSYRKKTILPK